ncbi:MAG: AAA family ATPase [Deltaproteobacteria bacterium]|nr:AAA family ATPase [Deltaproteobacteria bacterium]
MPPTTENALLEAALDADLAKLRKLVNGYPLPLDACDGLLNGVHLFGEREGLALQAALVTGRPLLVRGLPGVGKSQLARAAAQALGRALVLQTVDARTEPRDLMYRIDAVQRLADAQIPLKRAAAAAPAEGTAGKRAKAPQTNAERLALHNYVQPGALWFAFNWAEAAGLKAKSAGAACAHWFEKRAQNGVVVLIDEIDKAEADVPNALLDVLGNGGFTGPDGARVSVPAGTRPPLVVITTNEERAVPDAFLRRCLVLHLELPEKRDELIKYVEPRAKLHVGGLDDAVLREAAERLADDREEARKLGLAAPGLAELIDLLRAVSKLATGRDAQIKVIEEVRRLTYRKHLELAPPPRTPATPATGEGAVEEAPRPPAPPPADPAKPRRSPRAKAGKPA